jgi:hypothetical protein
VFLRVSEEATCDPSVCRNFTFVTTDVPEISAAQVVFDTDSYSWELRLDGTGFPEDTALPQLKVEKTLQTTKTATANQTVFTLTDVNKPEFTPSLLFPVGKPVGHALLDAGF